MSHTNGLIEISKTIMEKNGVQVEVLRAVDYNIAYGVYPDMTEHGWEQDDWPEIYKKVQNSDILILGTPI
jgi:multimeric flavodoxin WrbA